MLLWTGCIYRCTEFFTAYIEPNKYAWVYLLKGRRAHHLRDLHKVAYRSVELITSTQGIQLAFNIL